MPTDMFLSETCNIYEECASHVRIKAHLAGNKLLPGVMDTTIIWEGVIGALIFAIGSILFFEIRRFLRTYINKFKSLQDPPDFESNRLPDKGSPEI